MKRFHRLDLLDEVRLLQTSVTRLVPVTENLLEILYLQLLEVDCAEVNLLLVGQLADLSVFLLHFWACPPGRPRVYRVGGSLDGACSCHWGCIGR